MPICKQQICFTHSVKRKKTLPRAIQITDGTESYKSLTEELINLLITECSLCKYTQLQNRGKRAHSLVRELSYTISKRVYYCEK